MTDKILTDFSAWLLVNGYRIHHFEKPTVQEFGKVKDEFLKQYERTNDTHNNTERERIQS